MISPTLGTDHVELDTILTLDQAKNKIVSLQNELQFLVGIMNVMKEDLQVPYDTIISHFNLISSHNCLD
jgi:hypothetical protein